MRCPLCANDDTKVVDSRSIDDGAGIRRRRVCNACQHRFTTFERADSTPVQVVKRSGRRESFDRSKVLRGIVSAAKGRPVDPELFESIVDGVGEEARALGGPVSSEWVGLAVLDRLRQVDAVACLRFASVYKDFTDIGDFEREVSLIKLHGD